MKITKKREKLKAPNSNDLYKIESDDLKNKLDIDAHNIKERYRKSHTYFVSNLEVLVHNANCDVSQGSNRQPAPAVPYDPYSHETVRQRQGEWRDRFEGQLDDDLSNSTPLPDSGPRQCKKPTTGGKAGATDVPSWARGEAPFVGESGKDFSKRLLDERFGSGKYDKGPGSDYNKIKKWGDRHFEQMFE